jgi:tyrosyl-tRNA synthetase
MFGKLMSISDAVMWRYFSLLTDVPSREISALQQAVADGTAHPRVVKADLARRIVGDFHSPADAEGAAAEFDRVHRRGELPSDLRDVPVDFDGEPSKALSRVLVDAGLATSASDAGRKIQQGGVRVNGERCTAVTRRIERGDLPAVLQVGRHAVRLVPA